MVNMDSVTEVTSQGLGSRLMASIKGVFTGFILVAAAIGLLWWNEGRTVHTAKGLEEAGGNVISLSSETVDPANEGKLIHVTGNADTGEILEDPLFGIKEKAVHLKRSVEMYQWKENVETNTEKKVGGSEETKKTYSYSKDWSSSRIDSSSFKKPEGHENPSMPYSNSSQSASNVSLGAFKLSPELISMYDERETLELKSIKLKTEIQSRSKIEGNTVFISRTGGTDSSSPEVGDMKIGFSITRPGPASVIGVQSGNSFSAYKTEKDTTVLLLETGIQNAETMIQSAQSSNAVMGWILRGAGLLIMTIGFSLIFKPISTLGDVIPFIGSAMDFGFGIIAFIISFVISMIVIAIAWIFYRPLLGIGLLAVAASGIAAIIFMKKKKSEAPA